ncbi:PH domain-containing protein [Haloarchaeobius litoreus]|uniref:PH domain-containing protein n=1 Tax=Haloarchaeobius litoreus TaxID=755306 RepID=A0ABD6DKN9_9EURY|nr:PH domain-containing protein [Haloarchaeobius litoreus]
MEALHARVRIRWVVRAVIVAVVLAAVVTVPAVLFEDRLADAGVSTLLPGLAVCLLGIVLGAVHAVLLYRDWRFELQDDALYLERGVLTRIETAVPYVRVQHVDTQRSPVDRALGLSSVVIYTAGSRGADVTVPGLPPERAKRLRNELRELAVESEPEDAV